MATFGPESYVKGTVGKLSAGVGWRVRGIGSKSTCTPGRSSQVGGGQTWTAARDVRVGAAFCVSPPPEAGGEPPALAVGRKSTHRSAFVTDTRDSPDCREISDGPRSRDAMTAPISLP